MGTCDKHRLQEDVLRFVHIVSSADSPIVFKRAKRKKQKNFIRSVRDDRCVEEENNAGACGTQKKDETRSRAKCKSQQTETNEPDEDGRKMTTRRKSSSCPTACLSKACTIFKTGYTQKQRAGGQVNQSRATEAHGS